MNGGRVASLSGRWRLLICWLIAGPAFSVFAADTTPPTRPVVTDDGAYTTSTTTLHATWVSSDPESGIVSYKYRIRQDSLAGPILIGWTSTGAQAVVTRTDLTLVQGASYYVQVRAKNAAGSWSAVGSSDGILVDATPPPSVIVTDDGAYTSNATQLHVTWTPSTDPESGVVEYRYRIRQDSLTGPVLVGWTSAGTATTITHTGLALLQGKTYYVQVRAKNGAGLWSGISASDGMLVDTTPPAAVTVTDDGATTTSTTQLHVTWAPSSDPESGILRYQYQIRQDSPTGPVIRNWTNLGMATDVTATNLSLTIGTQYVLGIRARNGANLPAVAAYSDGITVVEGTPVSGSITTNKTWQLSQSPYLVTGTVTVSNGATLTIEPGVEVRFAANTGLVLGSGTAGILVAQGTAAQPIRFTSKNTSPAPGQWNGLSFSSTTAASVLDYCTIEYGGAGTNNANLRIISSTPTIQHSTIRRSSGYGLFVTGINVRPILNANTFDSNGTFPLHVELVNFPSTLSGNTYTNNGTQAVELVGGTRNTDLTLPFEGVPYVVTSNLNVYPAASGAPPVTLTLPAGTTLKFAANIGLTIGSGTSFLGVLRAQGTATQPVTFSSNNATPAPGQWLGVHFSGTTANSVLDHCVIEYGGAGTSNTNLRISSSAPTIQHSIIRRSDGYGIYVSGTNVHPSLMNNTFDSNGGVPLRVDVLNFPSLLANNTYTANGSQVIELAGGTLLSDLTLSAEALPYVVTSSISVYPSTFAAPPVTLTLPAGTTLKFAANTGLTIGNGSLVGNLQAQGSTTQPVTFTSNSATPAPGQWYGVVFSSATSSVLDYCVIEYGGGDGNKTNLRLTSSSNPTIRHSTIRYSTGAGIQLISARATIEHNTITANAQGIVISSSQGLDRIAHNTITGNTAEGLSNTDTFYAVFARLNWWGDASGPSGLGSGSGSAVSGNVLFEPWLTQAPTESLKWVDALNSPDPMTQTGGATTFFATLNAPAAWTVTIKNSANATVKTFAGSGSSIAQDWNGTDSGGIPLPNASYTFILNAANTGQGQTAAPAAGALTLNNTIPIANITSPAPDAIVTGTVTIQGTAAGTTFASYKVEYGTGPSPTSWLTLTSKTTPVTDGTLASWNTTTLTNSIYTLRLTVTPASGTPATELVTVRVLNFYSLGASQVMFSPNGDGAQDTITLNVSVTQPVNWTLSITNSASTVVKTFSGTSASPGGSTISQLWDGKNAGGIVAPDGVYSYRFQGTDPGTGLMVTSATGQVTVDLTPPTAAITAPTDGQRILSNAPLPFVGTADDTNFSSYTLGYRLASSSGSFTTLFPSSVRVIAGTLATLGSQQLAPNAYTFRLTVTDRAGNATVVDRGAILDFITITAVSVNPVVIDPYAGQSSAIAYTLNLPADVVVRVYDEIAKQLVRTLTVPGQASGANTAMWDGKNASGVVVGGGAYYVTIQASDASGRMSTHNDAASPLPGPIPNVTTPSVSATNFDPYKNDTVQLSYTISVPGHMTIQIITPSGGLLRLLQNQAVVTQGVHTLFWDGRREDGSVYQGTFSVFFDVPTAVPLNAILVLRTPLDAGQFRSEPYVIQPSLGEVTTFTYTLTRDATVSMVLTDPNGNAVRTLLADVSQPAGAQSVEWNGRTDSGQLVSLEGDYTVGLTLSDPVSGNHVTRNGTVVVYNK